MFLIKQTILLFLYIICIFLFGCFVRYLEYAEFFVCFNCEQVDDPKTTFDYIVVGSGSAGSIVARRLAEDKNLKILLLEAGNAGNNILDIPSFGLLLQQTPFDWQYTTVPQKKSCFSLNNNSSIWPMGKMVGGTGMLNNMIYVRGHPEDFNSWFKGKVGYSFDDHVKPYFQKLEDSIYEDNYYSSVHLSDVIFSTKLTGAVLNAAEELKYPLTNSTKNCAEGFGIPKINSKRGQRWTPAHTLCEKDKSNIFLRTRRMVEKILFHNNYEAYGVKYSYLGDTYIAKASKGVVLSAGVIGSAKILLHSGIGPRDHLEEIGINTKLNLPVGENLQDHLTTGFDLVLFNRSIDIGIAQILSPFSAVQYFWSGSGPWTTIGCEVLAHLHNTCNRSTVPDIQLMVMNVGLNTDWGAHFRNLVGINDKTWNEYFSLLNDTVTITILPVLLHPKSRGTVRLKDKHFSSGVLIDPKYLSCAYDRKTLIEGIEIIRKLVNTEAMKSFGARFNTIVFPPCKQHVFGSPEYWNCYIKHVTSTAYHPIGTCKMGSPDDETAVVDYEFRVKYTNNLFVVDGSILPTLTSGNINAAIYTLAEMASDSLKYSDYLNKQKSTAKEIFLRKDCCGCI